MKQYVQNNKAVIIAGAFIGVAVALMISKPRLIVTEKALRYMEKTGDGAVYSTSHGMLVMKIFTLEELKAAGAKFH